MTTFDSIILASEDIDRVLQSLRESEPMLEAVA